MDLPISEYMTRAQLKKISDDANQRNAERLRTAQQLQRIRERVFAAARAGQYSCTFTEFASADVKPLEYMASRMLPGCSVIGSGEKLCVFWS
jgi:hypothetical protein